MKFNDQILFNYSEKSYKGNMHLHTTNSDGYYAPQDVVKIYRDKGYDFIAISDHRKYVKTDEYNDHDFLVLNAFEMTSECKDTGKLYHIHGIVDECRPVTNTSFKHLQRMPEPKYESLATTQSIINDMNNGGMITMINHPAWSHNEFDELLSLHQYFAIEIYNHKAEIRNGTGNSVAHWDYLLRKGRKVFGIASDDAHDQSQNHPNGQYFGGWIVVNADDFTTQSLVDGMKKGDFYASTGPSFLELRIVKDVLMVKTSKVKKMKFITGRLRKDQCVYDLDHKDITEGQFKISGDERYIRVELEDEHGKRAWSNPVFIEDLWTKRVYIGV